MIHPVTIEWHNLIEDPTDLPTKDDGYFVTFMNVNTGELDGGDTDRYRSLSSYNTTERLWTVVYDDGYGDYGGEDWYENYKTPAIEEVKNGVNKEWVVVAWAEFPEQYIPQKPQGL